LLYSIEEGLLISSPDPDPPGPLADETGAWAATNGCDGEPDEESLSEGATRHDYDCSNGSALIVYIHPGGHIWPAGQYELDANAIIWEFLDQYTAPLPTE
jgi:poly(3-hydroxybutyrate) depolymerase